MELIVTGCENCCFKGHDIMGYWSCLHPKGERVIIAKKTDTGKFIDPENCPLNEDLIIIKKQRN